MGRQDVTLYYGRAEVTPGDPVVAGSFATWRLTHHVGRLGIDDGGRILIAFRFASDWGTPQTDDAGAANYVHVATSGRARLTCHYDAKGYIRPWQKCLIIDVTESGLAEGETVEITFGDRTAGSPGHMAQTFCEQSFEFRVAVDCHGTGMYTALADSPSMPIISGEPAAIVLVAPSQAVRGQPFWLGVRVEDKWGNPAAGYTGQVAIDGLASPVTCEIRPSDGGAIRLQGLTVDQPGTLRLKASEQSYGLSGESNPIICLAAGEHPGYIPLWADLHAQSEETVGTNSIEDYFLFARDKAFLDACAHQGNDLQITNPLWSRIGACVRRCYAPGRFVTLLGYEWSGNSAGGGDRNVYFLPDDAPLHRSSHSLVDDCSDIETDRYPASELFATLRSLPALTVAHVGGRPANLDFHDPQIEPLIEVCSAWGRFGWMIEEALRRGYRIGFVGGSDDHSGRPGACQPGRGHFAARGGLTCYYVRSFDRSGLWEAMRERRCYATTGSRIALDVRFDGHLMGEEYEAGSFPELSVEVHGTANIERIEIMRGLDVVHRMPALDVGVDDCVRLAWGGALHRGRGRMALWDGSLDIMCGAILECPGLRLRLACRRDHCLESPACRVAIKDGGGRRRHHLDH